MDQKDIAVQEPQKSVSVFSPPPAGKTQSEPQKDISVFSPPPAGKTQSELSGQDGERLNELAANIRAAEARNRQLAQMMLSNAIDTGRWLTEAKVIVGHGRWGEWLDQKLEKSQSWAQNMMRLYQKFGGEQESLFGAPKSQALGNLSVTKALRLMDVPDEDLDGFLEANDVEAMTSRQVDQKVRELNQARKERDEARLAAEQAAADQRAAEEDRAKLSADMETANLRLEGLNGELEQSRAEAKQAAERAVALERELAELKAKPVEVAVEADPAAIEAARKEAESAMKAKLAKARESQKKAEEAQKAAEEAAAQTRQELEQLRTRLTAQAQDGKRAAIAANEDLLLFSTLLDQAQELLNKMAGILMKTRPKDPEAAGKLEKALLALGEKVKGAAGG